MGCKIADRLRESGDKGDLHYPADYCSGECSDCWANYDERFIEERDGENSE